MSERFDADWLALREPFDHAARSAALARRLADRCCRRGRACSISAPAPAACSAVWRRSSAAPAGLDRCSMPIPRLLDEAFGRTAAWARRPRLSPRPRPGDALLVSTPHGLWRMQARAARSDCSKRVTLRPALPMPMRRAARCSIWFPRHGSIGLFDATARPVPRLPHRRWPRHLAAASSTRRTRAHRLPPRPAAATRALARHSARRASAVALPRSRRTRLRHCLGAELIGTSRAPRCAMQRALIDGAADAARDATLRTPRHRGLAASATCQAMQGRLAIRIGHRDILALPRIPPGG